MFHRAIRSRLLAALADTPVVLVHGARQTGKTTLSKELAELKPVRRYLTLDDATVQAAAVGDPAGFVAGLDGPVVLDEVQRAPGLFQAIKASVDRDRKPGRLLLTGSANVLLLPKVSESLAGRIEIIPLWPLSQGEIDGRAERFLDVAFAAKAAGSARAEKADLSVVERIIRGGYPEPLTRKDPQRRAAWFSSYIATILGRDVRDLSNIEGLPDLSRLLALVASRTSGLLNYSDLARGLSIPQSTLKRYLALLEATFLVTTIPAWSTNRGLRLTKAPKIAICDSGLACHLLGLDAERLASDGNARGPLLESFVTMELMKQASWSRARVQVFHFRAPSGREVDIALEDGAGRVVGIEVKSAASVGKNDFGGLMALREAAGEKFARGLVLYGGEEAVRFERDLEAVPISSLWS